MHSFHSHFKLRPKLNRGFAWTNVLRKIHILILISSAYLFFPLPVVNNYSSQFMKSSLYNSSDSSKIYRLIEQATVSRCSSSSLISPENIHSYTSMNLIIMLLYIGSILSNLLAQYLYSYASHDRIVKHYPWVCWCRKIIICLAFVSIFNQLVNTLACRPIDILYDIRFTSMLIVQIFGFFMCLIYAFFLGIKYASIEHKH
ncbi:unnamed protein product [Rotaria socialis]|uniref:Uncharacterized protein n=1 Tax=Rotaria socialis TaxID=392032 RepID=A0A818BI20_9BILA|nr:unnamed protein product [Rotaria socialis]CAF3418114.1 unnamed protein product [Rotaria socialis]